MMQIHISLRLRVIMYLCWTLFLLIRSKRCTPTQCTMMLMNDIKHKDTSIPNSHSAKQILRVQFAILLIIKSNKVLEFYNFRCKEYRPTGEYNSKKTSCNIFHISTRAFEIFINNSCNKRKIGPSPHKRSYFKCPWYVTHQRKHKGENSQHVPTLFHNVCKMQE